MEEYTTIFTVYPWQTRFKASRLVFTLTSHFQLSNRSSNTKGATKPLADSGKGTVSTWLASYKGIPSGSCTRMLTYPVISMKTYWQQLFNVSFNMFLCYISMSWLIKMFYKYIHGKKWKRIQLSMAFYSILVVKHQVSLPTRYPMTIFKGSSRAHPSTPLLQKCLYTQAVICIPHHEVTERYNPWKGSMAIATPISLGLSWPQNKQITTEKLGGG